MTKSVGNSPRPTFFQKHFPVLKKASSESALDLAKGILLSYNPKTKRERSLSQKVSSFNKQDPLDTPPAFLKRGRSFSCTVNPFKMHQKEKQAESSSSSSEKSEHESCNEFIANDVPSKKTSYTESSIESEESFSEGTSDSEHSDELYEYIFQITGDLGVSKIE